MRNVIFITFLQYFHNKLYVIDCYGLLLMSKKVISIIGSN